LEVKFDESILKQGVRQNKSEPTALIFNPPPDLTTGTFSINPAGPAAKYGLYLNNVLQDGTALFNAGAYAGIETTVPPPAPKVSNFGSSITVRWFHNEFLNAEGYNVYRSLVSGSLYSLIGSVFAPTDSFVDQSANTPMAYYYVITSVDDDGLESEFSKEIIVKIPIPKTVTFGETGSDTYNDLTFDTHLRLIQPTRNYGVVDNIRVKNLTNDEWRGLLKFDFRPGLLKEGVRDTSEITSALITLKLSQSEDTQTGICIFTG